MPGTQLTPPAPAKTKPNPTGAAAPEERQPRGNNAVAAAMAGSSAPPPDETPTLGAAGAWVGRRDDYRDKAAAADPVTQLLGMIACGASALGMIASWAQAHPGAATRALLRADVVDGVHAKFSDARAAEVIALLRNGGKRPTDAVSRLHTALAAGDDQAFVVAFSALVRSDAAALAQLGRDPAFLHECEDKLDDATVAQIRPVLLGGKIDPDKGVELTGRELARVEQLALATARVLHDTSKDAALIRAMDAYFGMVVAMASAASGGDEAAADGKRERARAMLCTVYQDLFGEALEHKLRGDLDNDKVGHVETLLAEQRDAAPEGTAPTGRMDRSEHRLVAVKIAVELPRLHAAVDGEGKAVWDLLVGFRRWAETRVIRAEGGSKEAAAKAGERRGEAWRQLQSTYERQYGRSLADAVRNGLDEADYRQPILALLEVNAVSAPEPPAAWSKELNGRVRERVASIGRKAAGPLAALLTPRGRFPAPAPASIVAALQRLRADVRAATKPPAGASAEALAQWDDKVETGMAVAAAQYARDGATLSADVRARLAGSDQREALRALGDRSTGGAAVAAEAVKGAEAGHEEAVHRAVTGIRDAAARGAEALRAALVDEETDDAQLALQAYLAEALPLAGEAMAWTKSVTADTPIQQLRDAYRLLGRSLRADIGRLGEEGASLFAAFGMSSGKGGSDAEDHDQVDPWGEGGQAGRSYARARIEAREASRKAFRTIEAGSLNAGLVVANLRKISVRAADLEAIYREENGVSLSEHLALERGETAPQLDPTEASWDLGKVGEGFGLDAAMARVAALHEAADDEKDVQKLLASGHAEENRVVLELFRQRYGYDLKYLLRKHHPPEDAERLDIAARTGGQTTLAQDVISYVTNDDLDALVRRLLQAPPAEARGVVDSDDLLERIRAKWGEDASIRCVRAATGELSLAELVKDRGAKDIKRDLPAFFAMIRSRLKGSAKEMDAAFQERVRAVFADPEGAAALREELTTAELAEVSLLVRRGGTLSAADTADQLLDKGGEPFLAKLREMPDDERRLRSRDPAWLRRLSDALSGDKLDEALQLIHGTKANNWRAEITGGNDDKVFETTATLDADQLHTLGSDPVMLAEIDEELDGSERALFEEAAGKMRDLGPSRWTDKSREMPSDEKTRQRQAIVIRHTLAIRRACGAGERRVLAALQACYRDRGAVKPDPKKPAKKEELFDAATRQDVWTQVEADVRRTCSPNAPLVGNDVATLEERRLAVLGQLDLSGRRWDFARSGPDDNAGMTAAIEGMSEGAVLEASNVPQLGPWPSLQAAFGAWRADESSYDAQQAFYQFKVDINPKWQKILAQDEEWAGADTSKKQLRVFKKALRTKIELVPSASIARAIGATEPRHLTIVERLANDRKVRLRLAQAGDEYDDHGGAFDGLTSTDEALRDSYARTVGAVGKASESDGKTAGEIDAEEDKRIEERLAELGVSREEYDAAHAIVANVLKTLGGAVLTAITTALSGAGGPSLMLAILSGGAGSGLKLAVDVAVLGDDADLPSGALDIVRSALVAALTWNVKELWEQASDASVLGRAKGLHRKLAALDEGLTTGAAQSWGGLGARLFTTSATSLAQSCAGAVKDAAFDALNPGVWKYGFSDMLGGLSDKVGAALSSLPPGIAAQLVKDLGMASLTAAKTRLFDEKPGLPGTEDVLPPGLSDPSVLKSVLKGAGVGGAKGALSTAGSLFVKNGFTLNERDVGEILRDGVLGAGKGGIEGAGTAVQGQRNNRAIRDRVARFQEGAGDMPDRDIASRFYAHWLTTKARYHKGELGTDASAWLAKEWKHLEDRVARQTEGRSPEDQAAYRAWVLKDPRVAEARVRTGFESFEKNMQRATELRDERLASPAFEGLNSEEKAFYELALRDPDAVLDTVGGTKRDAFDLTDKAQLADFKRAMWATKRALIKHHLAQTPGLDEATRARLVNDAETLPLSELPALTDPSSTGTVRDAVSAWASGGQGATAPARILPQAT